MAADLLHIDRELADRLAGIEQIEDAVTRGDAADLGGRIAKPAFRSPPGSDKAPCGCETYTQESRTECLMSPRQIVEEFVRRFNKGDATAIAELYHEDAVNHQVTQNPVEGRAAIPEMFEQEFAVIEMTCIPEIIHEAGDVAILEWRDPLGLRGCGLFTVRDGRIALSARLLGQTFVSQVTRSPN